MLEFTEIEMQAIVAVFADEVQRLEQEDKGCWDVAQWIGFTVFRELAEKAGKHFEDEAAQARADEAISCFGYLKYDELPEDWDELPYEEKVKARETANQ